ncbi:MAG: universal stress protein [Anaerolineales bacterium]|nr:universal stress protein [Anaerolineales bacterium]
MSRTSYAAAVADFQRARQQAGLQQIMARWTGESLDLLSYEEVRRTLQTHTKINRGLREIPLEAIVGSVGRYKDFTRTFLPKDDSDERRWASVKVAFETTGVPPIDVYQIGDVYFVQDGNHRVSVARQLGNKVIEAYVTEVTTPVPLTADIQPDELILKAEYVEFLKQTHLDTLRPQVDFSLTAPGKYPLILEHIEVHRYYMGIEQQRDIPYEEAVVHWCDKVYCPTVWLIREAGLLHQFPDRSEADLYVWLADHRAEVEEAVGWEIPTATAVADLAAQFATYKPQGVLSRVLNTVMPSAANTNGTEVGQWRRERLQSPEELQFARTLLVPIHSTEPDWAALQQAIVVAQREGGHIFGLFAVAEAAQKKAIVTQALQAEFQRRCTEAGVRGELVVEVGTLEELVYQRERWVDVMVLRPFLSPNGSKTPGPAQRILRRASGPALALAETVSPLQHMLLAYNDTPESDEALYVATYLASKWQIPLTVQSVSIREEVSAAALAKAEQYLSQNGVTATYLAGQGDVATTLVETAVAQQCDFIVTGSPRLNPMFELVLGTTVTRLLQQSPLPLLICR